MSQWWQLAHEKRLAEKALVNKIMRITVYGSFRPSSEKTNLLRLASDLRQRGFADTDIVEGNLRPNPWGYDSYAISEFYLENSDVNLLVFTTAGARLGVTTEVDLVLTSPAMVKKWLFCVVFDQVEGTEHSLGKLQQDRLADLSQIPVVEFETWEQLSDIAYLWAVEFSKKLGQVLRTRLPL